MMIPDIKFDLSYTNNFPNDPEPMLHDSNLLGVRNGIPFQIVQNDWFELVKSRSSNKAAELCYFLKNVTSSSITLSLLHYEQLHCHFVLNIIKFVAISNPVTVLCGKVTIKFPNS